MNDSHSVAVTGMGAVCTFGAGVERMWSALLQGERGVARRPELVTAGLPNSYYGLCDVVAWDGKERAAQLTIIAAEEALAQAALDATPRRHAVVIGTTLGGIDAWLPAVRGGAADGSWSYHALAERAAARFGATRVETVSVACASGNAALGLARDLLLDDEVDVVLAGGVDALSDFVIAGFGALRALDAEACRPFDRSRQGLNLGEGAALLVLERPDDARRRGAKIHALVSGFGLSADAFHMTSPAPDGRGAADAMRAALAEAGVNPHDVAFVSAHGTATVLNDRMEAHALHALFGASAPPVSSIKGALGHTLAAAGGLEAIVCVRALQERRLPPTVGLTSIDPELTIDVVHGQARALGAGVALSTSSGFGGLNCALVFASADSHAV